MNTLNHRFALELFDAAGASLGQRPIAPDWEPAFECLRLAALRRELPEPRVERISIEPVWHPEFREPCAQGVRLRHGAIAEDFPLTFFAAAARRVSSEFVEMKLLREGETFRYRLLAFAANAGSAKPPELFSVAELPGRVPVIEVDEAREFADDELPVLLPQTVLTEAEQATLAAGNEETGGVLIGHVCRERTSRRLFVRVTAQVPLGDAPATETRLTFTAEMWTAVRATIALRGCGELMLGTWHSHPAVAWCAKCPPERQRECRLQKPFFSEHDEVLTRTVFYPAYCSGLVITNSIDGLRTALFGWRNGIIAQRNFHISETPTIHDHALTFSPTA
jgi:hypothetical protein